MTPLDCALQKGFRSTAKYLQLHGGVPAVRLADSCTQLANIQSKKGNNFQGVTSSVGEYGNVEQNKNRRKYPKKKCSYIYGREEMQFSSGEESTQIHSTNYPERGQTIIAQRGNIIGQEILIHEKPGKDCFQTIGKHFNGLNKEITQFEEKRDLQPTVEKEGPVLDIDIDNNKEYIPKDFDSKVKATFSLNSLAESGSKNTSEDNSETVIANDTFVKQHDSIETDCHNNLLISISKSNKEDNDFKEKLVTEASKLPLPLILETDKTAVEENCEVALKVTGQHSHSEQSPDPATSYNTVEEDQDGINIDQTKNLVQEFVNKKHDYEENISLEHQNQKDNNNMETESGTQIKEALDEGDSFEKKIRGDEKPRNSKYENIEDMQQKDLNLTSQNANIGYMETGVLQNFETCAKSVDDDGETNIMSIENNISFLDTEHKNCQSEEINKVIIQKEAKSADHDGSLIDNIEKGETNIMTIENNISFLDTYDQKISQSEEINKDIIQNEAKGVMDEIANIESTKNKMLEDLEVKATYLHNDNLVSDNTETRETDQNKILLQNTTEQETDHKLQNNVKSNLELRETAVYQNFHASFNVLHEQMSEITGEPKTEKPPITDVSKKQRSQFKENNISPVIRQNKIRSKIPTPLFKSHLSKSDKYLDKNLKKHEDNISLNTHFLSLPNLQYDNRIVEEAFPSKSNTSDPPITFLYSDDDRDSLTDPDDFHHNKNKTKRFIKKRTKHRERRSAGSDCESSNLIDSGFEPSPRNIKMGKWIKTSDRGVNMKSVTQSIQRNIRR